MTSSVMAFLRDLAAGYLLLVVAVALVLLAFMLTVKRIQHSTHPSLEGRPRVCRSSVPG